MDPNNPNNPNGQQVHGRGGRVIQVAHRRSPSEMTPLMSTSLPFPSLDNVIPQLAYSSNVPIKVHVLIKMVGRRGTTRARPADRNASGATAADRRHAPAICPDGCHPTTATATEPISAVAGSDAEP